MNQPKSTTLSTTDETAFSRRHNHLYSTTVYLIQPPPSLSSDHAPWIITEDGQRRTLLHPLTSKPLPYKLPTNFDLTKLHRTAIAVSHNLGFHVDKLLVVPPPGLSYCFRHVSESTSLVLYNGGRFRVCPPKAMIELFGESPWVNVASCSSVKFDDVVVFDDKIYVIDRTGMLTLLNNHRTTRKFTLGEICTLPIVSPKYGFVWRKRFVVARGKLYLVARREENFFRVYKLTMMNRKVVCWHQVWEFEGNYVLFMAKDYYFFMPASSKFPGREYKNCIVFSESAFPRYGKDCWEFKSEDDIAVFPLADGTFGEEGESSVFPKINWSPPPWIFDVSFNDNIYYDPVRDSGPFSRLESQSESKRGSDEGEAEDSESGGKEVQSDLKDSNNKDKEEGMKSEEDSQDQEQEVKEVDSGSEIRDGGIIQCDSDSREKRDEEMHTSANIGDDASLQEDLVPSTDTVKASLSAAEKEATITLFNMNGGNGATDKDIPRKRKNNPESELRACTSSTTKSHISDSIITRFEGFDIRPDLVPTLQKIWLKHGNIVKNSIIHSGDIVSRALESLAMVVQILEDNSPESLRDYQANYLSSTLSDLKCMCFNVHWLVSSVDKAVQLHKSKPFLDTMKNLNQLSSRVKERRAVIIEELAKLSAEENELKEETEKVSNMVPFNGQVNFDEPLGLGLT